MTFTPLCCAVLCEQSDDGTITDFCSFYHLPSSIIGHQKHKTLFAAYSYYNVALKTPLKQLMHDMLIVAKKVITGCVVQSCVSVTLPPLSPLPLTARL